MTGQPLSVDDAYRLGFVARICTDTEALHAEADRYASWFADAAPDAIRLGRRAFAAARRSAGASGARRGPAVQPRVLPRRRAAGGGRGVPREAASGVGGRRWLRPTSSTPCGRRSASAAARSRPSIRRTSARRSSRRCWSVPAPTPTRSTTSSGAVSGRWDRRRPTSAGSPLSRPGCRSTCPGTTVDRQCGSSQQAVHFAAQAVMSGVQDLVVAGGVEVMSQVPIASPTTIGLEHGMAHPRGGERWRRRFGDQPITQFRGAELIAEKWDVSRSAMEQFALESHRRALAATDAGLFADEIVPVAGLARDEGPRRGSTAEALAALTPISEGGRLTAALASQISDGAAAILVASADAVRRHGLRPLARVHTMAVVGSDPVFMLTGPDPRHRGGPAPFRPLARRDRDVRGQRGVRLRRPGLGGRDRRRPRPDQPSGRRDRPRPPARRRPAPA